MAKTPAGITSSVKADDKTYILQTEFISISRTGQSSEQAAEPGGKIVTSVAIQGQIIHKVEKSYNQSWETEEEFAAAEKAVKQQHLSIARIVVKKSKDFLQAATVIEITPEDKLRIIPGVTDVVKIDFSNPENEALPNYSQNQLQQNFELVRNLILMISQNTRLGKLQKAVGTYDNDKFVLTGLGGNPYFLSLRSDADVSTVLRELDRIKTR